MKSEMLPMIDYHQAIGHHVKWIDKGFHTKISQYRFSKHICLSGFSLHE
jgi:hypothetical protein